MCPSELLKSAVDKVSITVAVTAETAPMASRAEAVRAVLTIPGPAPATATTAIRTVTARWRVTVCRQFTPPATVTDTASRQ